MTGQHRRVVIPFSGAPQGTCRWCGEPILRPDGTPNTRRRWHGRKFTERYSDGRWVMVQPGEGCLHEYMLASSHAYLRSVVQERDHDICGVCGRDCQVEREAAIARNEAADTHRRERRAWLEAEFGFWVAHREILALAPYSVRFGDPEPTTTWEADHIVPLVDGGSFALSNVQTACLPCHKTKTAREATARAGRAQTRDQLRLEGAS